MRLMLFFAAIYAASVATAQQVPTQPIALTIYNQSFAVARTSIDLDLHSGPNEVTTTDVTSMLEPDSVVLRDPSGKRIVRIVEQNYDAGVANQAWLLSKYEGKTINFQISPGQIVQGKIIRAGFQQPYSYNGRYQQGIPSQPLVEVNGQMQFSLPGMPLFPAATDGPLLKPTLRWQIQSENDARFAAELAYITGGLDWEATYNIVAPDNSDVTTTEKADFLGWVTIHNQSGTDFPSARIKLMAGDVAKLQPGSARFNAAKDAVSFSEGVIAGTIPALRKPSTTSTSTTSIAPSLSPTAKSSRSSSSTSPASTSDAPTSTMAPRSRSSSRTPATSMSSAVTVSTPTIAKSPSCRKSKTPKQITSACPCPRAASASIAATQTAR